MSDLARRWPSLIPFLEIKHSEGGPAIIDGHDCAFRPGDFQFQDSNDEPTDQASKVETFIFVCPKSGKKCGPIMVGYPNKPNHSPSWQFDGNIEKPTLHPSINCIGGCGWHGWVQEGKFRSC